MVANVWSAQGARAIVKEVVVKASLKEAWHAWTTSEGIISFFAPGCNVDLKVEGDYEIFFFPDAEPGSRGGEGLKLMSVEPNKFLSFTWNAPPSIPTIRKQRTLVMVFFEAISEQETRVKLVHTGWGNGEDWDKAYEYFDAAWGDAVLPRLVYRFEHGAVDWTNPPKFHKKS